MGLPEIKDLLAEVAELAETPRNRERRARSRRGVGKGDRPRRPGEVAYTVFLGPSVWARKFGFSLRDFYTDPDVYLEYSLRISLYRYKEIQDDAPLSTHLGFFLGAGFDSGLFGGEQVYCHDQDPWVDRRPVIRDPGDLERLAMPDFATSGLMPLAHRFYNRLKELAGDAFEVGMPEMSRGPFGLAWHLLGYDELMVALLERPEFVHGLLRFLTEARKCYETQRAEFLERPVGPGTLGNDEVNVPCISPGLYQEFVLPLEKELAEFHGGIRYWHCCGNIVPLLPLIRDLRPQVQHISPFNDFATAIERAGDSVMEVWMHPAEDVVLADEAEMARALRAKVEACEARRVRGYTVTTGHIQVMQSPEHCVEQARTWVKVARRVEEEVARSVDLLN
ncbi:MAG: hypothetical protein HYY04_16835 [Chloroflexi bacterium]|nr:hypothetical protein [Chloroflexota bacterium]